MTKEKANFLYFAIIQIITLSLMLTTGCATTNKSVGLGGAVGAGTGAILGGIVDPGKNGEFRTRNIVIGAALGGMAGMITGSVIHKQMDEQKKEAFLRGQASAPPPQNGITPALTQVKVRTDWIEGRAIGNRFIDGHFEYIIESAPRWEVTK